MTSHDLQPDEILRRGTPARAVLVRSHRSGLRTQDGVDLYTLVMNVAGAGGSRQVTVGAAVPHQALAVLQPGSDLPVRVLDGEPPAVAVDLDLAVREAGTD